MTPDEILDFWFGPRDAADFGQPRGTWFTKDPSFDMRCRERFGDAWQDARDGKLDAWKETAEGSLALCVLLDQLPRNMFRDSAAAFSSDAKAREVARDAVARGFDQQLSPVQRWFLYLPFEHSESLDDQLESLRLFRTLEGTPGGPGVIDYAQRHHDIVARFGRFPHRNALLGRESTPEEIAFLKQPGSSF